MNKIIVFLILCLLSLSAYAQNLNVEGVRVWSAPDHSRLVFDVDGPIEHKLFTLDKPERIVIDFKDNGYGITPEILDKIFMPFFTSKKHGSGIGLSLSRQIMHLHKGSISVKSKPAEGTVFTLTF